MLTPDVTNYDHGFVHCQAAISPCKLKVGGDFGLDSRTCDRIGLNWGEIVNNI